MRAAAVFALFVALLAPGRPAAAEKQAPPPAGTPKPFAVPAPKRFVLDNGLHVTFVAYGAIPKVRVELEVRVGNVDEAATQVWLADLTGRMLAEGTATKTATEVSEAAAGMGGSLDVSVGAETTELAGDVLSEFGPDFVRLVADVVEHPALPEGQVARIKTDLERELAIARSQPQQLALEEFRSVLYGDHPFGRVFPTPEMIRGFSAADVHHFYERGFGPKRAHLYVVGRFDASAVEAAVREAFASWQGAPAASPPTAKPHSVRSVHLVDRPGAVQSTLMVGLPVVDPSHPDYIPLSVTNTLLGGFFSSRITTNIREDKGYTYSPYSQITAHRGDAYWVENADVSTDVTAPALKEILFEIDRLRSTPPSKEELEGVQSYIAGVFVLQNSSRAGIINRLEFLERHGLPDDYLRRYVERVHAVTPEEVQAMARKYIRDDEATIVVVGDRKKIEKDLAPFGAPTPAPGD
jgi:zinc protease